MMRWWDNDVFIKRRTISEDEVFKLKEELIHIADAEIANELKGLKKHVFRVKATTYELERVGVTGNCAELGSWAVDKMVLLNEGDDPNVWTGEVLLPIKQKVNYRYVIVTDDNYQRGTPTTTKTIKSVRRWEAGESTRRLDFPDELQPTCSNRWQFLAMSPNEVRSQAVVKGLGEIDQFGFVKDRSTCITGGWLTSETALQLILFPNNRHFFVKELKHRPISTKFRAIRIGSTSVDNEDFCEEPNIGWPAVEVSILNQNKRFFARQDSQGTPMCEGDTAIIHIYHDSPKLTGIVIDFYANDHRTNKILHIGFACVHPCTISTPEGEISLDITNVHNQPVGKIKMKYVTIRNASHKYDFNCSMRGVWKQLWTSIETQPQEGRVEEESVIKISSETRDNTLASIQETVKRGGDFVEISVLLTNDGIPVFAHSPYIVVVIKQPEDIIPVAQYQVKVNEFTFSQLQRFKIHPVEQCEDFLKLRGKSYPSNEDNVPFPSLTHLLNSVDKSIGFVIDVKTLSMTQTGTYPKFHDHDINDEVDKILKTLHLSAGRRHIVLTSFHPDVCSMLRLKQNEFPVVFLQEGVPDKYPTYDQDIRCGNLKMAQDFAFGMEMLGIGLSRNTLLRNYNALELHRDHLIAMVLDDSADDEELRAHMNCWKLDGFLCCRRDEYGPFRRTFAYLLEPKDKELSQIKDWADAVEADGIEKPPIHPLKTTELQVSNFLRKSPNDPQFSAPALPLSSNFSLLKVEGYEQTDLPLDLSDYI